MTFTSLLADNTDNDAEPLHGSSPVFPHYCVAVLKCCHSSVLSVTTSFFEL